jgi:hypothetical protein
MHDSPKEKAQVPPGCHVCCTLDLDRCLECMPYLQVVVCSEKVDVCWWDAVVEVGREIRDESLVGIQSLDTVSVNEVFRGTQALTYMRENLLEVRCCWIDVVACDLVLSNHVKESSKIFFHSLRVKEST